MNLESRNNSLEQWFALRVKSRHEKAVSCVVRNKGFEEFLPVYESCRRWSDRVKTLELPLFPGYVFCRLDPRQRLHLLTIPGALHFAGIGKTPAPIDDGEIAAIRTAVHSGLPTEPWPFLEVGRRVRLDNGPLAGLEGILMENSRQHRVVISVGLLRRSVAVSIERHWAAPIDLTEGDSIRPNLWKRKPGESDRKGAGFITTATERVNLC